MALDGIVRMVDAFFRHCLRWLMQQPVVAAGAAGARGTAHRGKYRPVRLLAQRRGNAPHFRAAKTEHPHRRPSGRRNGMSRRSTERPPGTDMPVFHPVNLRRRSLLRIEIHQHSIISRGINVGSRGVNACLVVPTRSGRRASGPQRSRGLLGFSSRERHSERLPARCTPQATKTVSLPVNSTGRTEARPHATRRNARGRHGIPIKITREEEVMSKLGLSRRTFVQGSVGLTVANFVPGTTPLAFAATMEEQTVAAAKTVGKADVSGMIWSPYFVPMQPVIAEFTKQTGIGIGGIQDISIFDAPQRAMAEALSRSPQFDFIHIDSNMIPSLVSAGYLEPLDEYIEKAGFHLDVVADYGNFTKYGGHTYGVPTDGNVHIQYTRKDLLDDPDNKKRFADKFGTELKLPETWEENLRLQEFLMDPKKDLYGSGNLRNRANGVTWWYMIFYSAGGFPFDDDMKPTLNTPAGQYAVDIYLQDQKVNHPEAANWGTPQMIPRIAQGHVVSCQYWDGTAKLNENPEKSKTTGKWLYGLVPGSDFSGKRIHRSI